MDRSEFEQLFRQHYVALCNRVYPILKDRARAEDVVQEVMLNIWKRRETLEIRKSPAQYLHGAVIRRALRVLKTDTRFEITDTSGAQQATGPETGAADREQQLQDAIEHCVDQLPPRTQLVFRLCRFSGLTNAEAARDMDISVKTVENQMLRAFRMLRDCLRPAKTRYENER